MKSIEVQARILDYLLEELQRGNKEQTNLLLEFSGEIPFHALRAGVYTLTELGYIEHNDQIPDNQGFYCKITRDGIHYHQDIFEAKEDVKTPIKKSFSETIKDIVTFFENIKTIGTVVAVVVVMIFGMNMQRLANQFPLAASILGIEAETPTKEIQHAVPNKPPLQNQVLQKTYPLSQDVLKILPKLTTEQRKKVEQELTKFPQAQQLQKLRELMK